MSSFPHFYSPFPFSSPLRHAIQALCPPPHSARRPDAIAILSDVYTVRALRRFNKNAIPPHPSLLFNPPSFVSPFPVASRGFDHEGPGSPANNKHRVGGRGLAVVFHNGSAFCESLRLHSERLPFPFLFPVFSFPSPTFILHIRRLHLLRRFSLRGSFRRGTLNTKGSVYDASRRCDNGCSTHPFPSYNPLRLSEGVRNLIVTKPFCDSSGWLKVSPFATIDRDKRAAQRRGRLLSAACSAFSCFSLRLTIILRTWSQFVPDCFD